MTIYEELRYNLASGIPASAELRANALASAQSSENSGNTQYPKLVRALVAELDKLHTVVPAIKEGIQSFEEKRPKPPIILDPAAKVRVNVNEDQSDAALT